MEKKPVEKTSRLTYFAIVLLLGSFMYFFEIFYHGFVQSDFSRVQILLTFLIFSLSAGAIFWYLLIEGKLKIEDLKESGSFFAVSIVFLFLIFYTREMSPAIPFTFAAIYFLVALALTQKSARSTLLKKIDFKSPMIRFSFRFFIILGIMILPASAWEYSQSGTVDFRFHSIALPLINAITPAVEKTLILLGYDIISIPQDGGTTLSLADKSFSVFIGILCSGITSLSVFTAAFIALAMDLKTTLFKKTVMLVVGVAGTIVSNIFRITILFLVGLHFGERAMTFMHTHLGWVLYFIWITLFWSLAFRIADKPAKDSGKNGKGMPQYGFKSFKPHK